MFLTTGMLLLALTAAAGPTISIIGETGAERLVSGFSPGRLYDRQDWQEKGRWDRGAVQWPAGVSPQALFAVVLVGGQDLPCVVDGTGDDLNVLVDLDGDRDLRGGGLRLPLAAGVFPDSPDQRGAVVRQGGLHFGLAVVIEEGRPVAGTVKIFPDGQARFGGLLTYTETKRDGRIEVDGRDVRFTLVGRTGAYDRPEAAVAFDLDGDGAAGMDPSSDDYHLVEQGSVWLAGRGYRFRVEPNGDRLILESCAAAACPQRARVDPGQPAPPFRLSDATGKSWSPAELVGRPVLLHAWYSTCGSCKAQLPTLVRIAEAGHKRGLIVLGVNTHDDLETVREYAQHLGMTWPQLLVTEDDPFVSDYRIAGAPHYILLAPDGKIAARAGAAGDLEKKVEAILAADPVSDVSAASADGK